MHRLTKTLVMSALAVALVVCLGALAGCGCSRDKNGDNVDKTTDITLSGEWHLTEAMDQNNNSLELDADTKNKTTIIIKDDLTGSMSFTDGTYLGKFTRTPDADMTYQDAWGQYEVEAYTFTNADESVEIEFAYVVRKDGSQAPLIRLDINTTSFYYDK